MLHLQITDYLESTLNNVFYSNVEGVFMSLGGCFFTLSFSLSSPDLTVTVTGQRQQLLCFLTILEITATVVRTRFTSLIVRFDLGKISFAKAFK